MSQKQAKIYRKSLRRNRDKLFQKIMADVKTLPIWDRLHIVWGILWKK